MIIGICGKSGSGKSTIAKLIAKTKYNVIHCDIDKLGHHALTIKEVQEEAIKYFGEEIKTNGNIDRKKLGELVFSSRKRMKKLSDITWKHMQEELNSILENNENKIIILDWILLSHTSYFNMCDFKILIDIPYEIRKKRALERDNITSYEFDSREQASIEYDNDQFDIIINSNDINEIRKLVKQI